MDANHSDQPPSNTRNFQNWLRALPQEFSIADAAVIEDLMSIVQRFFQQIELAALNHPGAVSGAQELGNRFKLLRDGDSDLDRRLVQDPKARVCFYSNLITLVLVLSTGICLFPAEHRQNLWADTNQVIEKASNSALIHLQQAAHYSSRDILEFLNATNIEPRLENLYDLLPTTNYLTNGLEETEPRRVNEIEFDQERAARLNQIFKGASQRNSLAIGPSRGCSSASYSAESCHSALFTSEHVSTPSSSPNTSSPVAPSNSSDDDNRSRTLPLAENTTSPSESKAQQSLSELMIPNPIQTSSIDQCSRTTISDRTHDKIHINRTLGIVWPLRWAAQLIVECCSVFSSRIGRPKRFAHIQIVKVLHINGQDNRTCLAILDTGATDSFILKSVVDELKLVQIKGEPTSFTGFGGHPSTVEDFVRPKWEFSDRTGWHQDFNFLVVSKMPRDLDMLLGTIVQKELGIDLYVNEGACVAQEDSLDLPAKEKEKRQRQTQARDATANQVKRRQALEAAYLRAVQRRNAANAANAANPQRRS